MKNEEEIVLAVKELSKSFIKDSKSSEPFFALNKVSFNLHKGEILGIIGRNGAGKSTLLKVLSQITYPTTGNIEYEGILTSIIDIGSGFHPDLTGRENVFLSASLLGYSQADVKYIYDDIVSFSGLVDFMDTAVKHYSSGMYLRLAFSVMFYSKIDILLLDEVIAVGDANFRRKSYEKIRALAQNGTSIIIVSHSMESIIEFCDRCILIENGEIINEGLPIDIIEVYLERSHSVPDQKIGGTSKNTSKEISPSVSYLNDFSSVNSANFNVTEFKIKPTHKNEMEPIFISDEIQINLSYEKLSPKGSVEIGYRLTNLNGVQILYDSYGLRNEYKAIDIPEGKYSVSCFIPQDLLNRGVYILSILVSENFIAKQEIERIAQFKVLNNEDDFFGNEISAAIRPKLAWDIKKMV